MGSIDVTRLECHIPGGRQLFEDVSFKVGDGQHVALVGANGVGKTTLLRLVAGESAPTSGAIAVDGRVGVMHQLVGVGGDTRTVRDLFASIAPPPVAAAAAELDDATRAAAKAVDALRAGIQDAHAEAMDALERKVMRP